MEMENKKELFQINDYCKQRSFRFKKLLKRKIQQKNYFPILRLQLSERLRAQNANNG
tara:strand:+ start:443 stop:613 length:171 start_codon:yes stop_codon:yes gene_type:complete